MNKSYTFILSTFVVFAGLVALLAWNPSGDPLTDDALVFFCAAGMKPPVDEIIQQYEDEYGVTVHVEYSGSGTLLGKLNVSAIGDLYLAADQTYIDLAKEKFIVQETLPVAHIKPVILIAKDNPKQIQSLKDLWQDDIRLSLANPGAASIGRTVRDLLTESGDWDALEESADVKKPTVNDVANDVLLGAVDAGIVWDAVAAQYEELDSVSVPKFDAGAMQITLGVLTSSRQPTSALHFARYLTSKDKGLPVFERFGYEIIDGDAWADRPAITLFSGTVNRPAIDETLEAFQEREGVDIKIQYNGCGVLVANMKAGQKPDAYFACDVSFMYQVNDLFMDATSVAQTDIVIAVPTGNPLGITSIHDLANTEANPVSGEPIRVGVCNPEISALGALTNRLLVSMDIIDPVMQNVQSKVPTGDFLVNQLSTGSLDAVIVYDANTANVRDTVDRVMIDHPLAKAVQPFAVSRQSEYPHIVERLLAAIRTADSQKKFESKGFTWIESES